MSLVSHVLWILTIVIATTARNVPDQHSDYYTTSPENSLIQRTARSSLTSETEENLRSFSKETDLEEDEILIQNGIYRSVPQTEILTKILLPETEDELVGLESTEVVELESPEVVELPEVTTRSDLLGVGQYSSQVRQVRSTTRSLPTVFYRSLPRQIYAKGRSTVALTEVIRMMLQMYYHLTDVQLNLLVAGGKVRYNGQWLSLNDLVLRCCPFG